MRVVLYERYSSANQTEQSIEGQDRICVEFCNRNGYEIIDRYIDRSTSAFKDTDKRVQFLQMIEDAEKHKFDAVVVYKLDRFSRNRYDSAIYKAKLKKSGVDILSATENISDNPEGVLLESVLVGMAEFYSKELSQKVIRGKTQSAIKCNSTGGTITLGYSIKDKKYVLNDKAFIVKELFERFANGETIKDISDDFNRKGYRSVRNNEFKRTSLQNMLRNRKYIGEYSYNGDYIVSDAIPRIVSDELFERVQNRLNDFRHTTKHNDGKSPYLLTGKLFCGHCKEKMVGYCAKNKLGNYYYYYKCNGVVNKSGCTKKLLKKDDIEDFVIKETINLLTADNINALAEAVEKEVERINNDDGKIIALQKDRDVAVSQKNNLISAIANGVPSKDIAPMINGLNEEIDRLESEIDSLMSGKINITKKMIIDFLNGLANGDIRDNQYREKIINLLVYSVYVFDNDNGGYDLTVVYNIKGNNKREYKGVGVSENTALYRQSGIVLTQHDILYIKFFGRIRG